MGISYRKLISLVLHDLLTRRTSNANPCTQSQWRSRPSTWIKACVRATATTGGRHAQLRLLLVVVGILIFLFGLMLIVRVVVVQHGN